MMFPESADNAISVAPGNNDPLALSGHLGAVTSGQGYDGLQAPVLRKNVVPTTILTGAELEDRIREVAALPDIGGYRKIAAALLNEHGVDVSHMKVKRVLDKLSADI